MPALKPTIAALFLILAVNVLTPTASGQDGHTLDELRVKVPKLLPPQGAIADSTADTEDREQSEQPLEWIDVELADSVHQVQFAEPLCDEIPLADAERTLFLSQNQNSRRCASTYWVRADYLQWWLDGANVPVLVTTSPVGTSRTDAGVLGLSTTTVLFGGDEQNDKGRSGGRIEFGRWFESRGGLGWHFAYFGVDDSKTRGRFAGNSIPILARPFFSVEPTNVGQNAELVAFPGELEGNIAVDNVSSFDGAELMFRWMLANNCGRSLQLVAGYQYNGLDDDLTIVDFKRVIGGSSGLAIGTTLAENDQFQTKNRFNGVAVGILASARSCRTTLDLGMQLALGNNNSKVRIDGSTTASVPVVGGPNDVATARGGLLALPTNIGLYENDVFAVVPQLNFDIGYDLHPQVRATFGYRFLYWSQVARAAEQIDTGVNLSQLDPSGINGEARPAFEYRLADFWAQGINLGLDYRF